MAFERKFKEGDKVRVKKNYHQEYNKVGEIICYVSNYGYIIKYGNFRRIYSVDILEKVDSNTSVDTTLNVVYPEDLKPGCKVKLKEIIGTTNKQKLSLSNTIQIISKIKNNNIILENYPNISFAYYNFDKIIEEPEDDPNSLHIGDQVINRELNHSKFGKTGYIISYYKGNDYCSVRFQNSTYSIKLEYLEKVKSSEELNKSESENKKIINLNDNIVSEFKIGDKVKICFQYHNDNGKVGEIINYIPTFGYVVKFGNFRRIYYTDQLEKVTSDIPISTTVSTNYSSDFYPGFKVKIKKITDSFNNPVELSETIQTISKIEKNDIYLENYPYIVFHPSDFTEIVEVPKEDLNIFYIGDEVISKRFKYIDSGKKGYIISIHNDCCIVFFENSFRCNIKLKDLEKVKSTESSTIPLKEGQVVTLLDGEQYKVRCDNEGYSCDKCALRNPKRCEISFIHGFKRCVDTIPYSCYYERVKNSDQISSNSNPTSEVVSNFTFTKHKFTLTDFTFESIGNSKSRKIL